MGFKESIKESFRERYGQEPCCISSAPGRVNLIGEHTDYNQGFVLPMAIDRRVWAAGRCIDENVIRLSSDNQEDAVEIKGVIRKQGNWADYPLGVIWSLRSQGCVCNGVEIHFSGDVPLGGGLSSSAAIEVATAFLARVICNVQIQTKEIVRHCQVAENSFIGIRSGVMDQMASTFSKKDHALYIDCRDTSFEHVHLEMGDYCFAIINSGVTRNLQASGYNKRRSECEEAARQLGVSSLRDLGEDDVSGIDALPEPLNKRARHVRCENARVHGAREALKNGNFESFGRLMGLSHASLRDDYEVSTPEMDFLVEGAQKLDGVLGARLTGAGFGGCIVALAHKDAIPTMESSLLETYRKEFGKQPNLVASSPEEGARIEYES